MKLYYSKGACSLAIRIIIHELNLACDYESVNLKTKMTETGKNYLEINPKGAVPCLELSPDKLLTENNVIQQYLAETNNAITLFPAQDNFERYRVLEWMNYISTDLHKSCAPLFNPQLPQDVRDRIFIPILKNKLSYIDQAIANQKYLLGDNFSLPDAYLFVVLRWLPAFDIVLSEYDNLCLFFNNIKDRPSVAKALQEEN